MRLSPNSDHDEFLTASKANLLRFLALTGQDLPVTREVSVWNVPDLPLARQSRRRLEPDLGVWPAGTRVRREAMLQWEEVVFPRLVVECLSRSTTHNDLVTKPDLYRDLGVEEYWVCRAHPMQARAVYQRDDRGRWQARPVPDEQGLFSRVLGTRVRIHKEDGFQCQDPATGQWIEADASFYHEGYGEGYDEGQYRERQQSLPGQTQSRFQGSVEARIQGQCLTCRSWTRSWTTPETGPIHPIRETLRLPCSLSSLLPKFCVRRRSWRTLGRSWRLSICRPGRLSRTFTSGTVPARDHADRRPGWIDSLKSLRAVHRKQGRKKAVTDRLLTPGSAPNCLNRKTRAALPNLSAQKHHLLDEV